MMLIRPYNEGDKRVWQDYVFAHSGAHFFHRVEWKQLIEQATGHHCPFLLAEEGGRLCGILPLTFRASPLFGKALIAGYFGIYGDAIADGDAILRALYDHAFMLARDLGADYIQIKQLETKALPPGFLASSLEAARFQKPLLGDKEAQLQSIPRKQRAVIRKSFDMGLRLEAGARFLTPAYKSYGYTAKKHGTPLFPQKLFLGLAEAFGRDMDCLVVFDAHDNPVASLISFYHQGVVMPYYVGGSRQAAGLFAHDFLYYKLMERAIARGCHLFDFGRSKKDTGPYRFKKNWGFEPSPLVEAYRLKAGGQLPNLNPQNPRFRLMSRLWRHLPHFIADHVGPFIARDLG